MLPGFPEKSRYLFQNSNMKTIITVLLIAMTCPFCTTSYYVVRHAEKVDNSADPPLSPAGRQRALALRDSLRSKHIDTIFSTGFKRTQQTVEPLAVETGKSIRTYTGSVENVITELNHINNKRVLVAGHSNTVPQIVQGLSGRSVSAIADNDFDNLYIIRVRKLIGTKRTLKHVTYGVPSP